MLYEILICHAEQRSIKYQINLLAKHSTNATPFSLGEGLGMRPPHAEQNAMKLCIKYHLNLLAKHSTNATPFSLGEGQGMRPPHAKQNAAKHPIPNKLISLALHECYSLLLRRRAGDEAKKSPRVSSKADSYFS
jgi:hypothetical protein